MVMKMMKGFNPNSKRSSRRTSISNVEVDMDQPKNYYNILQLDDEVSSIEEFCDVEFCGLMRDGPFTYQEAMKQPDSQQHHEAAIREMKAFSDNEVYELVPPKDVPAGEKLFNPKWVLGRKWDGTYKARLTVDGSRQKKGIHYFETRSDTISLPLLRFMLCLIMIHNLIPYQFDVPNAFLQSKMDTPVYL
jgi:hypothetical protein